MRTNWIPELLLFLSTPLLFVHALRTRGLASALSFFLAGAAFGIVREPLFTRVTGLYEYAPATVNLGGVPLYLGFGWTAPFYLAACISTDLWPNAGRSSRLLLVALVTAAVSLPVEVIAIQPETRWWTWLFTPRHSLFGSPALVSVGWALSGLLFVGTHEWIQRRIPAALQPVLMTASVPALIVLQAVALLLVKRSIPFFG